MYNVKVSDIQANFSLLGHMEAPMSVPHCYCGLWIAIYLAVAVFEFGYKFCNQEPPTSTALESQAYTAR